MTFLPVAAAIIVVLFIASTVKDWRTRSTPLRGIPYNKYSRWNPLGDILALVRANTPVDYFSRHVQEHGNICQVLLGPLGRLVLVADVKEIEENLLKRSHDFDKASAVRAAFGGTVPEGSVGLPANGKWKLHRRMMTPSMSPAHLSLKTNYIFANAHRLIAIWSLRSKLTEDSGGMFECDDDIERFAMDTVVDILFGENLGALNSSHAHLINIAAFGPYPTSGALKTTAPSSQHYRSFRHLLKCMGLALRSGAARATYWRLLFSPSWHAARRNSYNFIDLKLTEHMKYDSKKGGRRTESFLDLLCNRYPLGRPAGVSASALKDELLTYIIGGADTSATVICWIIKYLSQNPRVQIRLHAELSASLKNSDTFTVSYDELQGQRFPYLDAVISEALRLANVGGVSARDALEDVFISGCRIPKGSQVFFLTGHAGINNAPAVEASPEIETGEYYPERWIEKDASGRDIFNSRNITSWPFGYGPRGCPGQRFAVLELKALVITLSLSFFLEETRQSKESHAEMLVVLRKLSQTCIKLRKWSEVTVRNM